LPTVQPVARRVERNQSLAIDGEDRLGDVVPFVVWIELPNDHVGINSRENLTFERAEQGLGHEPQPRALPLILVDT